MLYEVRLELWELGLRELIELLELLLVTQLSVLELLLLELCELRLLLLLEVDCQLRDRELWELRDLLLLELLELAVLAVVTELRLCELAVTKELLLSVCSLCEDREELLRALIEECEVASVLALENDVLDIDCVPMIVLISVSMSLISEVRLVPYRAMSSGVNAVGYSALMASISRARSLYALA